MRRGSFGITGAGDTSGYGRLVREVVLPGSTPRPYGGYFDDVVDTLITELGEGVHRRDRAGGGLPRANSRWRCAANIWWPWRRRCGMHPACGSNCAWACPGVHYPTDVGRELHAVYPLMSITHNRRIRLEVAAPDADGHVPSLYSVYPTTDWHERETYDFFGIVFDGHPSLTRIEMPDDWVGHPQRKDYPLGGIPVQYHGATIPPPDERRSYH